MTRWWPADRQMPYTDLPKTTGWSPLTLPAGPTATKNLNKNYYFEKTWFIFDYQVFSELVVVI